jgi:hypothetical protein
MIKIATVLLSQYHLKLEYNKLFFDKTIACTQYHNSSNPIAAAADYSLVSIVRLDKQSTKSGAKQPK